PFENATRARWGRRRAIRKERRRDSVRAHVEEVRRGGWPAAAPNPKGWAGNGHRAASLVVDSRDKACLLLVPCAVAVPGPARSCGVLKRSLASRSQCHEPGADRLGCAHVLSHQRARVRERLVPAQ